MAISYASFVAKFKEFDSLDADVVSEALASALSEMNLTAWGELADKGQALLAAHELAMSPFGRQAGLQIGEGKDATSIYWGRLDDLRRRVGTAYRPVLE